MNDSDTDQPMEPEEQTRDLLAGEYVLGTLTADERADVERRLQVDSSLRAAVQAWEKRLGPLVALAPPVEPSPDLWLRIERTIATPRSAVRPAASPVAGPWRRWWNSLFFWRGLAAASVAMAALLALRPTLIESGLHPHYVVVLVAPGGHAPGWVVQVRSPADARLAAIIPETVPADRAFELWTKADNWQAPVSLGLVRPGEPIRLRLDSLPVLQSNQLFEITLEPPTGSPTGRPTGPIQYIGRAVELRS